MCIEWRYRLPNLCSLKKCYVFKKITVLACDEKQHARCPRPMTCFNDYLRFATIHIPQPTDI